MYKNSFFRKASMILAIVVILVVCPLMAFGQFKVNSDGVFKTGGPAGRTGKYGSTNVSFGFCTMAHMGLMCTGIRTT